MSWLALCVGVGLDVCDCVCCATPRHTILRLMCLVTLFSRCWWWWWWWCFCYESANDELNGPINISCSCYSYLFSSRLFSGGCRDVAFAFQNIQHLCAIDSIDFMVCNNVAISIKISLCRRTTYVCARQRKCL